MRGTLITLESTVEGMVYELNVREIRLKEKDRQIARLEQQVQELKRQAMKTHPDRERPMPPFVKANVPRRRRRKPGRLWQPLWQWNVRTAD